MSYMPATRTDDALKRFLLASLALHLAVAAHPEEGLPQDQERPAVADHVDGELHGIARRPDRSVVSLGQLVRPLLWIQIETSFYMKPYVVSSQRPRS